MSAINPINLPGTPISAELQSAFEEFAGKINLDPGERRDARERLSEVTGHLREDGVSVDSFLQGSLARRTMVSPLRDIDAVVILESQHGDLRHESNGARRAASLVTENLRQHYPGAKLDTSRHSVKLDLGEDTFSFDVVPAFESLDSSDDVEIMDLRTGGWSTSNAREIIRVVKDRDAMCGGAFVQQVRFVKHWSRRRLGTDLPGLHVESIAYCCVTEELGHAEAVESILTAGARLLGPLGFYFDPTGVDRLDVKLDSKVRAAAQAAFQTAAESANRAMELASLGRIEEAQRIFAELLGESFPMPQQGRSSRRLAPGAATAAALRGTEPSGPTPRAWHA